MSVPPRAEDLLSWRNSYGRFILANLTSLLCLTLTSALANKLMVRATNYFDAQVRIPSNSDTATHIQQLGLDPESYVNGVMHLPDLPTRKMTDEQIISWYTKILDSVRLRYRKLQRFTRCMRTTHYFENSYFAD